MISSCPLLADKLTEVGIKTGNSYPLKVFIQDYSPKEMLVIPVKYLLNPLETLTENSFTFWNVHKSG